MNAGEFCVYNINILYGFIDMLIFHLNCLILHVSGLFGAASSLQKASSPEFSGP